MRKKLTKCIATCLCASVLFTGCSGAQEKEKDPSEPIAKEEIGEGYYILGSDGEYYLPNLDGQNFT